MVPPRASGSFPGAGSAGAPRDDLVVLESCTTTWAFETGRKRFARLPRGVPMTSTSAEWRPYSSMWFDLGARTLVVALDEAGTRLLQSDIHNGPCSACQTQGT